MCSIYTCVCMKPVFASASAQGFMEFTYLFYGFYNNTVVEDSAFSYNIPLAYIVTIAFYFVLCFIGIIVRSVSDF